jgi:hypothetical protein
MEATTMNRYSERSARTYRGNYSTFQSRILAELPHLACDGDSAVLDLTKLQLEHVKGCLTALVHRKKADGTPDSPSKTALTVIRCSIKYAYEMAKIPTPAWYAELGPFCIRPEAHRGGEPPDTYAPLGARGGREDAAAV